MAIKYNSYLQRATHVESGLTVQWVRDDYPRERRSFFCLISGRMKIAFESSYDFGENKIRRLHPDFGTLEQNKIVISLREMNYHASNIEGDFDRDIFVNVFRKLLSHKYDAYRISIYYAENIGTFSERRWCAEG